MKYLFSIAMALMASLPIFAQPSNDDCGGVIELGTAPTACPFPDTFSNVGATLSNVFSNPIDNVPTCFIGGAERDVWFQFTVPADGSVVDFTIELAGVNGPNGNILQPQLAIYRGDCMMDGLAELDCVVSSAGEINLSWDLMGATPGLPIFLRISDWSATGLPNWGDFTLCIKALEPIFNMGEASSSTSCTGTLYDSGGPNGDYSTNENNVFTVCPQEPTACIGVEIVQIISEEGYDFLRVYAGDDINAPLFANFDGFGNNVLLEVPSQCATFQFISDNGTTDVGFELKWQCSPNTCVISPPSTCSNPTQIPSLPFISNDLTTCNAQNAVGYSPCDDDDWMQGEDVVFTYVSEGDECISVQVSGSSNGTAVGIFDDCPELATTCIKVAGGEDEGPDPVISAAFLPVADTYYMVVDNPLFCTPFNIEVNTVNCPVIMPPAAICENAQSMNGCGNQPNLPSIVNIAPGQGDPDFLQDTVNIGCWGGFDLPNFTFFYFQAQADGEFAFVMASALPAEASDIDFQVWGPISNFEDICGFAATHQPIRSSYAQGAGPTGLTHNHPANGDPVLDTCEIAGFPPNGGDGYLTPVQVQVGEFYLVMINDYGGDIESGAISIDFSGTSPGVLDPVGANFSVTQDTAICIGESVQLLATDGEVYQWYPAEGLNCQYCPNPVATITEPTTFHVSINRLCLSDTLDVAVDLLNLDAGPDYTICLNQGIPITASSNFSNAIYQWSGPTGFLSCTDCPTPTASGLQAGSFVFYLTATGQNCALTDSMVLNVLPSAIPSIQTIPDQGICLGASISLGGPPTQGVNYSWSSNPAGFSSTQSNPNDTPVQTTTYYLQASTNECPIPFIDSVVVTVSLEPNFTLSNEDTICLGEEIMLSNSVPEPGIIYQWAPQINISNPDSLNAIAFPSQQTTYVLTASRLGCMRQDSITIHVHDFSNSILEVSPDTILPCGTTSIQLLAQASEPGGQYLWTNGDTTQNPTLPLDVGTNSISVLFTGICQDSLEETIVVEVTTGPTVEILSASDSVYLGSEIMLQADTNRATNVLWSNGSTADTAIVTPTNLPTAFYSIIATDEFGCEAFDTITFEVLEPIYEIPNVFSPNGDNVNDVFKVVTIGENILVQSMKIWNRWGTLVFESKNSNEGWDGRQKGKESPSDVYIYSISIQRFDGTFDKKNGDLTLLR